MKHEVKFQDQGRRNAYARQQRAQGRKVRNRSRRNLSLSPDYVADYSGPGNPNGFGGNGPVYFGTIYIAEVSS